jgi:nucleoside-diphosphate-sugar epimerase
VSARHLILGATGLAGAALTLELLEGGENVCCLVRADDSLTAFTRLRDALEQLTRGRHAEEMDDALSRCVVVNQRADGAVDLTRIPQIGDVWDAMQLGGHADSSPESVLPATNEALALAADCGAERYHFFSAADAFADQKGTIRAAPSTGPIGETTPGRKARIAAEQTVLGRGDLKTRVLRTGMMLGPVSAEADRPAGAYALLQLLHRLRGNVIDKLGSFLVHRPITVISTATASVIFVPCDVAVRAALAPSRFDDAVVHLLGPTPLSVGDTLAVVCEVAGFRPIRCVSDRALMTSIDRTVDSDVRTQPFKRLGHPCLEPSDDRALADADVGREVLRASLLSYRRSLEGDEAEAREELDPSAATG